MKIHQILITDNNTIPEKLPDYGDYCQKETLSFYEGQDYKLWSGNEIENFLSAQFSQIVVDTYHKLKPYSYKADLARYCLLYVYGGLYFDLNTRFINPFVIDQYDPASLFVFRDYHLVNKKSWSASTTIMYAKPNSPVLETAIDILVTNVKNNNYGHAPHMVTGPGVLGQAIMQNDPMLTNTNGELICLLPMHEMKWFGFVQDNGNIVAFRKPVMAGDLTSLGYEYVNNYFEMWNNLDIYNDNN